MKRKKRKRSKRIREERKREKKGMTWEEAGQDTRPVILRFPGKETGHTREAR